ncbi:DUF3995 domain-containing protein [Lysinibacillus sphaericus]|uniref:DUF3995 domain-containing protein n=1 Tax=Lysinibacillus sphaericus TaxID=1421 RepID=UPI003F78DA7D
MKLILTLLAVSMLCLISMLHVYWAYGGRWGSTVTIPVKGEGDGLAFVPRKTGTLLVAVLICMAALLLLVQGGFLQSFQANIISRMGCIVCSVVFFIRAIGDFKYVGFFKKIKHSQFARNDTWFYSPLCLFFAAVFMFVLL